MIPRLTNTPAPLPLYAAFLAELRTRGFAGDADDLVRIARAAQDPRFADVKLAPRGGGTGTNGQSLTDGLVVDVSRHMNRILSIDPAARRVRVQAGGGKEQPN